MEVFDRFFYWVKNGSGNGNGNGNREFPETMSYEAELISTYTTHNDHIQEKRHFHVFVKQKTQTIHVKVVQMDGMTNRPTDQYRNTRRDAPSRVKILSWAFFLNMRDVHNSLRRLRLKIAKRKKKTKKRRVLLRGRFSFTRQSPGGRS